MSCLKNITAIYIYSYPSWIWIFIYSSHTQLYIYIDIIIYYIYVYYTCVYVCIYGYILLIGHVYHPGCTTKLSSEPEKGCSPSSASPSFTHRPWRLSRRKPWWKGWDLNHGMPFGNLLHSHGKWPIYSWYIGDLPIKNGGLEHLDDLSIQLGMLFIPTDEVIFFRGVGIPPTRIIGTIEWYVYNRHKGNKCSINKCRDIVDFHQRRFFRPKLVV
jgi:hypothetical protein